jgi:hypothetical protein
MRFISGLQKQMHRSKENWEAEILLELHIIKIEDYGLAGRPQNPGEASPATRQERRAVRGKVVSSGEFDGESAWNTLRVGNCGQSATIRARGRDSQTANGVLL